MKTPLRGILAVALCAGVLAAGGPPLHSQETPPPDAPAATAAPGSGMGTLLEYQSAPVTYSLQDVMKTALENNLEIQVQRYNPQISESLIETQEAVFSPLLNFAARESESTQPGNSQLSGGLSVTDSNRYASGTYTDFFTIGGRLDFTVFTNRPPIVKKSV